MQHDSPYMRRSRAVCLIMTAPGAGVLLPGVGWRVSGLEEYMTLVRWSTSVALCNRGDACNLNGRAAIFTKNGATTEILGDLTYCCTASQVGSLA
jgi:hypothetical protein